MDFAISEIACTFPRLIVTDCSQIYNIDVITFMSRLPQEKNTMYTMAWTFDIWVCNSNTEHWDRWYNENEETALDGRLSSPAASGEETEIRTTPLDFPGMEPDPLVHHHSEPRGPYCDFSDSRRLD